MKMLTLKFEYQDTGYEALIRVKSKETATEYYITIMNGDLEKMLYGHHVITEVNGRLQAGSTPDAETARLKNKIMEALEEWLSLERASEASLQHH